MEDVLAGLQVLHEVREAPGCLEHLLHGWIFALVEELDLQALGQEGQLLEAFGQRLPLELDLLEDLPVRPERDRGAGLPAGLPPGQPLGRLAASERLRPRVAVPLDLDDEPFGERVHDRDPHPVQAARDAVTPAPELPAGVQGGQDDLQGRPAVLGVGDGLHRDAPAVVCHPDAAVREERHHDPVTEPGHGLVDRVVHDLVDQVMQTPRAGGPDVHPGPESDVLDALQNRDVGGGVPSVTPGLVVLPRCRQRPSTSPHMAAHAAADEGPHAGKLHPDSTNEPGPMPGSQTGCFALRYKPFRGSGRTTICTVRTSSEPRLRLARLAISRARNRACAPHGPVLAATTNTPPSRLTGADSEARRGPTTASQSEASRPMGSPRANVRSRRSPSTTSPIGVSCMVRSSRRPRPANRSATWPARFGSRAENGSSRSKTGDSSTSAWIALPRPRRRHSAAAQASPWEAKARAPRSRTASSRSSRCGP